MSTIKHILLLFISFTTTAVLAEEPNVEINGTIKNGEGRTIFLKTFKNDKSILVDSALIKKNGKFNFKFYTEKKNFFSLNISGKKKNEIALLILDNKENNSINFNSTFEDFGTLYNVEGSHECDVIEDYVKIIYNYQKKRNLQTNVFQDPSSKLNKDSIKTIIDELDNKFKSVRSEFILRNKFSMAVIITASSLNPQQDLELYKTIRDGLLKSAPGSEYQIAFSNQVDQIEQQLNAQQQQKKEEEALKNLTAIGNVAPELNFNNPEGKLITLKSLRGNYVLIDFWASWCRPCRMENPNVVKLYNKYKEQGFTVFSVSLDNNVDRWVNAIKADNLSWPNHVSDLKQWRTEATKIYGFRGIPYTVLIDKEGKIIAKNLRGPSLEAKLKELFGS